MAQRNLDGVYFQVERDGEWCDVCFTDLTDDEAVNVLRGGSGPGMAAEHVYDFAGCDT